MTEFGQNGAVTSTAAYSGPPRTRTRNLALAIILCSLGACAIVAVIGFICMGIYNVAFTTITGDSANFISENGFFGGVYMAIIMSALNFFLFFLTVPAAALALSLSIGRFPYRGITHRAPYMRWGAIWGAILVGTTTALFGLIEGALSGLGAFVMGTSIGGAAGTLCGLLFLAIVKPARQATERDLSVFE